MEKEILQALEKNQFCKTTTHGDAVILSSEIKKLYHLFTEMIEKGVYRVSNQTQMIIRCNAKISVNLYTIIADIVLWYSARMPEQETEQRSIEICRWIRLGNPKFFMTFCEKESLGTEFLHYFQKSNTETQQQLLFYFFSILHSCPPFGFTQNAMEDNIGKEWYLRKEKNYEII